ncbi:MAG: SpoIID/LytB domain-containing protein [Myxococcales bacterium]|nr:SpoIID/LytB domain-containing protein [Myxococcales bacterium]MCB9642663.1 SpoIID/LytB domain-containing protein [Myxococcales bacterium]
MPNRWWLLPLLCAIFGAVTLTTIPSRAVPSTTSLHAMMERLYAGRFWLNANNEPSVTVGIMDKQEKIEFSCKYGCRARLYQRNAEPQETGLEPNYSYTIRRLRSQLGWARYWLIAFATPHYEEKSFLTLQKQWEARGFGIHPLTTGGVFALQGHLFDTRKRLGSIAVFAKREDAQKRADQLENQLHLPIRIHEELARRPQIRMLLQGGGRIEADDLIEIRPRRGLIRVERVEFGRGYRWHRFVTRHFDGPLLFTADRYGKLTMIQQVSLSTYLRGVLRAEMPSSAPLEALKAQAVCARNEILAKIATRHRADPYLFCAQTHCQVYTGALPQEARISRAIQETRGVVMTLPNGQLSDAPFSAVSGGHTEHNEHVWSTLPNPALRGKPDLRQHSPLFENGIGPFNLKRWLLDPPDAYCRSERPKLRKKFRWTRTFSPDKLDQLVNRQFPVGHVKDLVAEKRGVSGRIYALRIVGAKRTLRLHGELKIRRLLDNLWSSMFLVQKKLDAQGQIQQWKLIGGGWGHGVGLCQYGAIGRARDGQNFRQILKHYFSQIRLLKLY